MGTSLPTDVVNGAQFLAAARERAHTDWASLLVFRCNDFPQLSWQHGRDFAYTVERATTAHFARICTRVLREPDWMIHDAGSQWYAIALWGTRRSGDAASLVDVRSTLTRVQLALENETELRFDTGWTSFRSVPSETQFAVLLEDALEKGRQERERYHFFSILGHELRTPLTSIRGYLETLLEHDLDATQSRHFLGVAYRETLRIGRLVENLFDISLLDLHHEIRPIGECCLQTVMDAALLATAPVRQAMGVALQLIAMTELRVQIREDALTHILINLIDNAAKHGAAQGTITLTVDASDERTVRIIVDDDGPGIPPELRSTLFNLGERGPTTARGSGLGLGLVRLFAERAGGEIHLGDSPYGGASFVCVLPRVPVEAVSWQASD